MLGRGFERGSDNNRDSGCSGRRTKNSLTVTGRSGSRVAVSIGSPTRCVNRGKDVPHDRVSRCRSTVHLGDFGPHPSPYSSPGLSHSRHVGRGRGGTNPPFWVNEPKFN